MKCKKEIRERSSIQREFLHREDVFGSRSSAVLCEPADKSGDGKKGLRGEEAGTVESFKPEYKDDEAG